MKRKYQSSRYGGVSNILFQNHPEFFKYLSDKQRIQLSDWIDSGCEEFKAQSPMSDPVTFGKFLLKCIHSDPFWQSKLVVDPVTEQGVDLKRRIHPKLRREIFDSLDNQGQKSTFIRSWFLSLKKVLVTNVTSIFGTNSFCPTRTFTNSVMDEHAELHIIGENEHAPVDVLRLGCSKFSKRYINTLAFPPKQGNIIEFEHASKRYVQFEDTHRAEKYIALVCRELKELKTVHLQPLPLPKIVLDQLEGKQKDAATHVANHKFTIISGKAGTGKSHTVRVITDWLKKIGSEVFCISPYHKTVSRLRELGVKKASTSPSWSVQYPGGACLGECQSKKRNAGVCLGDAKDDPSKCCFICTETLILDESGIAGSHDIRKMFEWVMSKKNHRLVLVGDQNQLPPISGGSAITGIADLMSEFVVELETIRRVSPGKEALITIANNILVGNCTIPESDVIETIERADQVWDKYTVGTSIVVTNSNAEATSMNRILSKRHFESIPGATFVKRKKFFYGEVVCVTKGEHNGTLGTLESTKQIEVLSGDFTTTVPGGEVCVFGSSIRVWIPLEDLTKGYAVTVNKAQGSEFDQVFVVINGKGLRAFRNKRWMYTAITRAKKKLYFITDFMTDFDYYNEVLRKKSPSLKDTTLIRKFFHHEKSISRVPHVDWEPTVPISECHDVRIEGCEEGQRTGKKSKGPNKGVGDDLFFTFMKTYMD